MSLRNIGRLGSGSSVRQDLDTYLDDLYQLTRFLRPEEPGAIKAYDLTIPALTNGVRTALTLDLGSLNYPNRLILGMFSGSTTNTTEVAANTKVSGFPKGMLSSVGKPTTNGDIIDVGVIPGVRLATCSCLNMMYPDYNDSTRGQLADGSIEKYGAGAGTLMPKDFSYSQIGVGVLVGWYGSAGAWGLDKKIELESMWIDNSNLSNIVLHIALYNRDSAPNTPLNLVLGVYD